jgi:hypothetical protein
MQMMHRVVHFMSLDEKGVEETAQVSGLVFDRVVIADAGPEVKYGIQPDQTAGTRTGDKRRTHSIGSDANA